MDTVRDGVLEERKLGRAAERVGLSFSGGGLAAEEAEGIA